jgi:CRP-like cAMP-binding protein
MAFVGPVTSGVLLGLGGTELAMAVLSGLLLIAALLVVRLRPHPPHARIGGHPFHLLRHVPRTATVVAKTPVTLLSLEREGFLEEVTGHPVTRKAVDVAVQERIQEKEDVDARAGEP